MAKMLNSGKHKRLLTSIYLESEDIHLQPNKRSNAQTD